MEQTTEKPSDDSVSRPSVNESNTGVNELADDNEDSVDINRQLLEGIDSTVVRESWESKCSYILVLIGYAIGFGNIWRFPYLLQENGGVVFLVPYTISVFFLGVPIFYLELALGQRFRKGPIGCWHEISPYLGGMGITTCLMCFCVVFYYNILVAWVIAYLADSFRSHLLYENCSLAVTHTDDGCFTPNVAQTEEVMLQCRFCEKAGASQYYWNRRFLNISESISVPGEFNWWILIWILVAWAICFVILVKGASASGKVVYVTALFPHVVLVIFLIRGLTLPNMSSGYTVLFTPKWEILADPTVWKTAASQIFYSLGVGYGCLIAFASYLHPNNDCHSDAILIAIVNCGTSVFATLVMFPFLGYYGHKVFDECKTERQQKLLELAGLSHTNAIFPHSGPPETYTLDGVDYSISIPPSVELSEVPNCVLRELIEASASGTGFVFIVFAQAISTLPAPQIWAVLFFLMLFTLGIDSAFGTMEGAIAAIVDLQLPLKRWHIATFYVVINLMGCSVFAFGWGQYILTFMDDFSANWPLLTVGIVECIGVAWVYGLQRFVRDLTLMTGKRPSLYWLVCWKYVSPLLVLFIFLLTLVDVGKDGVAYRTWSDEKGSLVSTPYPAYAVIVGFGLSIFVVMWIPLVALLRENTKISSVVCGTYVYFICFFWCLAAGVTLSCCGIKLIKDEAPIRFPEEELIRERNYNEDEVPRDSMTKIILWGSLKVVGSSSSEQLKPELKSATAVEANNAGNKLHN